MNLRRFVLAAIVTLGVWAAVLPAHAQEAFQIVPHPTGVGSCIQAFPDQCGPDGSRCGCFRGSCVEGDGTPLPGPSVSGAAGFVPSLVDSLGRPVECDYTFCDMIRILINASQIIFGLAGGLALVYFLYGGFFLIVSGWKPEWIKKGTETMKEAIFGLICVIVAYQFIGIIALALVQNKTKSVPVNFEKGYLLFQNNWAKLSDGCRVSLIQKK